MTPAVQQWLAMALVALAAVVVLRRWLPAEVLRRLGWRQGRDAQASGCGACTRCSNCGTTKAPSATRSEATAQPVFIVPRASKLHD